ncbi:MAG: RNA polymerase sigma factor [Bacteroidota bacterium]
MSKHLDKNRADDQILIDRALNGSRHAVEVLVKRHQDFVYNVAMKMVMDPEDAADLAQEALIKVVTNLSKFQGRSSFRTWAYRIVVNHYLNAKRSNAEKTVTTFDAFGQALESAVDQELTQEEQITMAEAVTEARLGCMSAMLLCLDREQRLIYTLGDIFQIDHHTGAQIFDLSPDNYRQKLSRARRDLYSFMQSKCGLINKANPCRCRKKTKAFIQRGWVDENNLRFANSRLKSIRDSLVERQRDLADAINGEYLELYRDHPYHSRGIAERIGKSLLSDPRMIKILDLEN